LKDPIMTTQHAVDIMNAVAIMRLLPAEDNIQVALDVTSETLLRASRNSDCETVARMRRFLRDVQDDLVARGKLKDLLLRDALFGVNTLLMRR
jgi:hypothetical protein